MILTPATVVAALALSASPASANPNALTAAEEEAGWTSLFDGSSADHWRAFRGDAMPDKGWEIVDGTIRKIAGGGGGDIITREQYKDFEFAFEWKVAPGANSGIFYHVSEDRNSTWETGPEYQILDDDLHQDGKNPKTSAAALYAMISADGKSLKPVGEWNTGRILVVGNHVEHWLNGRKVVSYEKHSDQWKGLVAGSKFNSMPAFGNEPMGHIALQDHGDDVWYRGLKVRDLTLREDRLERIFDGCCLSGWTGYFREDVKAYDVFEVTEDEQMICKGQPIGYLRTVDDFTNYVLRVRWRFDPAKGAGNSGVLLRMVGEDTVWPKSIEAQLHSGAAGDFWNIGEFPMEVAPERTRGRNTKRTGTNEKPLGEWNEYEITVWKGFVVLRVNGEILNQAWNCEEVPGKICLQSEGAEIHFKDIELMPLD